MVVRILRFTPFGVLSHRHHATAARLHTGQSGVHVVGVGGTGLNSLHRLFSDLLRFGVQSTHKLKTAAVEQVQTLLRSCPERFVKRNIVHHVVAEE